MSSRRQFQPDRIQRTPSLGAREITSYSGPIANDNGPSTGTGRVVRRNDGARVAALAFATGLVIALACAGLAHLLTLAG